MTVAEYFAAAPPECLKHLKKMRAILRKTLPKAEEVISYGMPAFKTKSVLVYYAGYKRHIGFYPTAEPMRVFADRMKKYKTSKGAVQFPLEEPLPETLIKAIAVFRAKSVG